MFNKQTYIDSNIWRLDDTLVQPATATKLCKCCGKTFYTIDFPDVLEFVDGKLPVCVACFRAATPPTAFLVAELLESTGVIKKCVRCEAVKQLGAFSFSRATNGLMRSCKECGRESLKGKFK